MFTDPARSDSNQHPGVADDAGRRPDSTFPRRRWCSAPLLSTDVRVPRLPATGTWARLYRLTAEALRHLRVNHCVNDERV